MPGRAAGSRTARAQADRKYGQGAAGTIRQRRFMSQVAADIQQRLADYRRQVDAALTQRLPPVDRQPEHLHAAMHYAVLGPGKRIRPALCCAAAEALRIPGERLDSAACALEFIHAYSLVHDDLPAMDDDTLRRGRPTLHVVYGEGIAILAGDGLLTEAFALLARQRMDDAGAGRRLRVLARIAEAAGVVGMVGGQAIDLESEGTARIPGRTAPALDGAALQDMHARKTGALIRAAAVS